MLIAEYCEVYAYFLVRARGRYTFGLWDVCTGLGSSDPQEQQSGKVSPSHGCEFKFELCCRLAVCPRAGYICLSLRFLV